MNNRGVLVDCFFYSFYMPKHELGQYIFKKRHMLLHPKPMRMEREFKKPCMVRSHSQMHSLDSLAEESV